MTDNVTPNDNDSLGKLPFKLIPYNTGLSRLELPEFGRQIQQMVDHCLTIEDREERTMCAYAIVDTMARLFPEMKTQKGDHHVYWDNLNIMARFQLDIDFPYDDVITADKLHPQPEKIPYSSKRPFRKVYGRTIEPMIEIVSQMEDGEEKEVLISMLANHMKKQLIVSNPEGATDARVFRDLEEYSEGKISLDPEYYRLNEFAVPEPLTAQKGKKKKKK